MVVSGASSGIGLAAAKKFAAAGAQVVGLDLAEPTDTSACAHFVCGDVRRAEDWERCVEACGGEGIDVLVNNAGVDHFASIDETTPEDWQKVISINLTGCYLGVRACLPGLRGRRGAIVNVASALGLVGGDRVSAYCASKGGVVLFTKALAVELGPAGIRVNCVCPGPIDTPFLHRDAMAWGTPQDLSKYRARTVLGRLGSPAEVADAILFLASHRSSFLTGVALPVDGGRIAR